MDLTVVGWYPGLKKISLTHLLNAEYGLSVYEAKALVDLILSRSEFEEQDQVDIGRGRFVRLSDPVVLAVPHGLDPLEARRMLMELGLEVVTACP